MTDMTFEILMNGLLLHKGGYLEKLRAYVHGLEAEVSSLERASQRGVELALEQGKRIIKLEAEIERLKATLPTDKETTEEEAQPNSATGKVTRVTLRRSSS
jgi:uncharacterized small protein (DUF1192 family)